MDHLTPASTSLTTRMTRLLLAAALGLGGTGCGLHDTFVHRDGRAIKPFGTESDRAHGLSSTLGTDLSELKSGEKAPDPVPGSDLW